MHNEQISEFFFFSIFHANAGGGDGFEGYYWSSSSDGKKLVNLAEKQVKAIGQNSRGAKSGDHLYFVKNTKMTAVLFESFFLDNDKDNDIGDTVAEQKAFGVAYAKAILEYLGIKYISKTDNSATEKAKYEAEIKSLKAKVSELEGKIAKVKEIVK